MAASQEMPAAHPLIHPSALVDPRAELGRNVRVGPHSIIGPKVRLGDDCVVGANVLLDGHLEIGRRNRFYTGAVLGTDPQDLKFEGGPCRATVGDDNTFREYSTVNVATTPEGLTSIGNHCLVMAYAHIAHNCVLRDHVIIANACQLAGHVEIDDWAILGGMSPVHQFVVIGAHAFIGGHSSVRTDVPPYVKASGSPITLMGINSRGLQRRGYDADSIARIKRAYRYLFRRGLRVEEALQKILSEGDDEVARTYQDFFARSGRGSVR